MDLFLIAAICFFIFLIAIFGFWIIFFLSYWTFFFGAGLNIAPKKIIRKMLKLAELRKGEILYDLGCGNGRILILGAKEFEAHGIGIEISPFCYLWSKFNVINNSLSGKVKIKFGNFFKTPISDADVITIFLSNRANKKLIPKFKKELKSGTRIVSYYWQIPGMIPEKVDKKAKIYMYRM